MGQPEEAGRNPSNSPDTKLWNTFLMMDATFSSIIIEQPPSVCGNNADPTNPIDLPRCHSRKKVATHQ